MAALFQALNTANLDELMGMARTPGAKEAFLRGYATRIVSEGLFTIKSYNSLSGVNHMEATTWFGAAFAVACSNETHGDGLDDEHRCHCEASPKVRPDA